LEAVGSSNKSEYARTADQAKLAIHTGSPGRIEGIPERNQVSVGSNPKVRNICINTSICINNSEASGISATGSTRAQSIDLKCFSFSIGQDYRSTENNAQYLRPETI
jgi:hypothetical protein